MVSERSIYGESDFREGTSERMCLCSVCFLGLWDGKVGMKVALDLRRNDHAILDCSDEGCYFFRLISNKQKASAYTTSPPPSPIALLRLLLPNKDIGTVHGVDMIWCNELI